jgi:CoA:oxalate CoA-transferase
MDSVKEWNAVVAVDDRNGGMPGNPWIFSRSQLPLAGTTAFQGEHNGELLLNQKLPPDTIADLKRRRIVLSRRTPVGPYD